jgi:hypothetical protein
MVLLLSFAEDSRGFQSTLVAHSIPAEFPPSQNGAYFLMNLGDWQFETASPEENNENQ